MLAIHSIKDLAFEQDTLSLTIDGMRTTVNLELVSPKLKAADPVQRNLYKISPSGYGIHWPLIDEDLSVETLLKKAGI